VDDIRTVTLEKQLSKYGYLSYIQIQLKTGRRLKFTHPETKQMYQAIRRWQEQNIQPASSIAGFPNHDSQG